MLTGDWLSLYVLWAVTVALIVAGCRPITDRQLERWAVRLGVLVKGDHERWARAQLRRARAIRWTAFALGLNIGALPMYMNVIDVDRAGDFANAAVAIAPFAGAALGSVIAEIALFQRRPNRRAATLTIRHWRDYVDRVWIIAIAAAVPLSAIAALVGSARADDVSRLVWFGPLVCVVSLLAVTLGVRIVVNRPVVVDGAGARRIDDALRADGAHHIAGAAIALSAFALTGTLGHTLWSGVVAIVFALVPFLALGVWHGLATTRWNVDQARLQHA
ncbi:MAG: hypothetical protein AAGF73_11945 [Actinomycetota bacterium]